MARGRATNNSESTFEKWLKEGRGAGHNHEYKPWLTVRDLSSTGRSHRIFGQLSQRTHHLLSDLELAVFLIIDWNPVTLEIREQFPLQRESTIEIAKSLGISHPAFKEIMQYMSSDFLVNTKDKERPKFALQAKYVSALKKPRTIEKLEIERRYWLQKNTPWYLITEQNIPEIVFKNIAWLYPAQSDDINLTDLINRGNFYSNQFRKTPKLKIIEICKKLDSENNLPLGEAMKEMRQLLAHRFFLFNIYQPITQLTAENLKQNNISYFVERYVSNQ